MAGTPFRALNLRDALANGIHLKGEEVEGNDLCQTPEANAGNTDQSSLDMCT